MAQARPESRVLNFKLMHYQPLTHLDAREDDAREDDARDDDTIRPGRKGGPTREPGTAVLRRRESATTGRG